MILEVVEMEKKYPGYFVETCTKYREGKPAIIMISMKSRLGMVIVYLAKGIGI